MKYFAVGNSHPLASPFVFWTALATLVLAGATTPAFAQCTFPSGFGTATIDPTGAVITISTCSFAGEYSTINGAVSGQTLKFTTSVATDFITIHSGTPNGPVLAFGTTPLTFANTFTGTIYAHWATDAACGTQSACRITAVQCTSCLVPINDTCAAAIAIGSPSSTNGTTVLATPDAAPTCVTTLNTAPGVWYSFTPSTSASFTASLCGGGTAYDSKIGVFRGTCAAPVCVTGNDDFCGLQSQVTFNATAGTTYLILVTGFGTASGAFTLDLTGPLGCDSDIYVNGPLATGALSRSGVAAPAGTQWSEVSHDFGSTTATNTVSGFGCQRVGATTNNRCADDFIVPAGDTFTVTKVTNYAYQTGYAGVLSPVVDANVQIWDGRPGDPGAVVVAGDPTSLPFTSVDVSLYRIFNSGPPLNTVPGLTRRIWENTITLPAPAVLAPGTYWVDFQIDTGAAPNFAPPVTITGHRTVPGWNGRQFTGAWEDLLDTGNPASEPDVAQDMAFKLEGCRALPWIFVDGFENSTTSAWSETVP